MVQFTNAFIRILFPPRLLFVEKESMFPILELFAHLVNSGLGLLGVRPARTIRSIIGSSQQESKETRDRIMSRTFRKRKRVTVRGTWVRPCGPASPRAGELRKRDFGRAARY
ncbi:hypothetical protein Taro_018443 [Colocasia esculenta]|uniref:Uncharacterized protein n=1 Tax=Colocasia esculenta TaxID=4460 RepID=A0A843UW88_COLES|nr:hypothetical protein [Colocasia esculenta]